MDGTTRPVCPYCGARHRYPEALDFEDEVELEVYCTECCLVYHALQEWSPDGKFLYCTRKQNAL